MFSIFKYSKSPRLLAIISFVFMLPVYSSVIQAEEVQELQTLQEAEEIQTVEVVEAVQETIAPPVLNTEAIIAQMLVTKITRLPKKEQQLVKHFYQVADQHLIWLNNPEITTVFELLTTVKENGLDETAYHKAQLEARWLQLQVTLSPSFQELVDFDIAVSRTLLSYLADLNYGRIHPRQVKFGFQVDRDGFKLAQETFYALSAGKLNELVSQQQPQFVFYQNLKHALQVYQQAAQKHADIKFKFPKTLRIGRKHQQVPLLRQYLTDLGDIISLETEVTKKVKPITKSETKANIGLKELKLEGSVETSKVVENPKYDKALAEGVKNFQRRHGLKVSGRVDKKTLKALNKPLSERIAQIELGLERLRWMPRYKEDRLVFVNVPSYRLWAFNTLSDKESKPMTMRVVVGKAKKHETPVFSAKMQYLAFRPYWNIPRSIIKNEIMPKLNKNPNYLAQKNMERVGHGIRQRPGIKNALGLVKFMFPNRHAVYLHDTPSKRFFKRTRRDYSHGCIRVAKPISLAEFALEHQSSTWNEKRVKKAMNNGNNRHVQLETHIPVIIFYSTVMATESGTVHFLEDIYGHDKTLERALEKDKKQVLTLSWDVESKTITQMPEQ